MRFIALTLASICLLMFIAQQFIGTATVDVTRDALWSQPWRMVTGIFAHGNFAHLLVNLFALGLFGLLLESVVGPYRVLALFSISGVLINSIPFYERSLGASGAIYALIGALVILRPRMPMWVAGFPMPMFLAGMLYSVKDIIGLFIPSTTAHAAHLLGLVLGIGAGFLWLRRFPDTKVRQPLQDPALERAIDAWESSTFFRNKD